MQILQNMDPDKMVIVLPTALIAMYFIISLQKSLCEKRNPFAGLVLPVICFIAATILAFRPLFVADTGQYDGLVAFCLRMWLTFNIVTLVFLFPYYKHRRMMRAAAEAEEKAAAEGTIPSDVQETSEASKEASPEELCSPEETSETQQ